MLKVFADILSNRDVFYETIFLYLQALCLLKLDSFEKNSVMHGILKPLVSSANKCSLF